MAVDRADAILSEVDASTGSLYRRSCPLPAVGARRATDRQPAASRPADFTVFFQGHGRRRRAGHRHPTPEGISITGNERIGPAAEHRHQARRDQVHGRLAAARVHPRGQHRRAARWLMPHDRQPGRRPRPRSHAGTERRPARRIEIAADARPAAEHVLRGLRGARGAAARAKVGDELPAYVPPAADGHGDREGHRRRPGANAGRRCADPPLHARTGRRAGPDLDVELWADANGTPASLLAARPGARRRPPATSRRSPRGASRWRGPTTSRCTIPANGFSLAGHALAAGVRPSRRVRLPAVVLVGGSAPTDRDETVAGIPILGQLAAALARRRLHRRPLRQARRRAERRAGRDGHARGLRRRRWPR